MEYRYRISIKDASKPVIGYLTYMTCDNKQCLPPQDVEFNLALPAAGGSGANASNSGSGFGSISGVSDDQDDKKESGLLNPVTWKWEKQKIS